MARPWFWALLIGGLWVVPLIKSLGAELPPPLPGIGGEPLGFELPVDRGGRVSRAQLGGNLLVVRQLSLGDVEQAREELTRLHELRGRLRGLGSAVLFVFIASGGSSADLTAVLDERTVRKPVHVFLHDAGGQVWGELCRAAGVEPGTESLLLDRHGRLRGAYAADVPAVDRLVSDTGQLANWPASDPPPEPTR